MKALDDLVDGFYLLRDIVQLPFDILSKTLRDEWIPYRFKLRLYKLSCRKYDLEDLDRGILCEPARRYDNKRLVSLFCEHYKGGFNCGKFE